MKNNRRPLAIACGLLLLAIILVWAIKARRSAVIESRAQHVEQGLNSDARIDVSSLRMLLDEMKETLGKFVSGSGSSVRLWAERQVLRQVIR